MATGYINDCPLEARGLRLESISAWRSAPTLERASVALPGAHGHVPSRVATTPPRSVILGLVSTPATDADMRAHNDRITEWLTGLLEFATADQPDRLLYCEARSHDTDVAGSPKFVERKQRDTIELVAYDAARYDRYQRALRVSSTPTPVRTGTLDGGGVLYLFDVSGSTIVRTRHTNGTERGTMTLTGSTPTNGWWELDLWHRTIESVTSAGVRSNGSSLLTAGDWFALVAADSDRETEGWCTIEVSSGRGLLYRRNRYR